MTYRLEWSSTAVKQLRKIPKKQRILIAAWVRDHLNECENPRAVVNGRPLKGTRYGWRWRVGSYRILGEIFDEILVIKVIRVGHRQGVYSALPID